MLHPWDTTAGRLLLISGLPGAGKTDFAAWLESRGWARIEDDRLGFAAPDLAEAWAEARAGRPEPLEALAANRGDVVVEWGFVPLDMNLELVRKLAARGWSAWYFDGDRPAAFRAWRQAHPVDTDDMYWFLQVGHLEARRDVIRSIYSTHVVETIRGDGSHVAPEETATRMALL